MAEKYQEEAFKTKRIERDTHEEEQKMFDIQKQIKSLNSSSMIYYDGVPKHLLDKNKSESNQKDRLSFAK